MDSGDVEKRCSVLAARQALRLAVPKKSSYPSSLDPGRF